MFNHSNKTIEDLFLVVLFTVLFKVVVTFKDEILVRDHSIKNILPSGTSILIMLYGQLENMDWTLDLTLDWTLDWTLLYEVNI